MTDTKGKKVEARIDEEMAEALRLYKLHKNLTVESEVLRSALGLFLRQEGFLKPPPTPKPVKNDHITPLANPSTSRGRNNLAHRRKK